MVKAKTLQERRTKKSEPEEAAFPRGGAGADTPAVPAAAPQEAGRRRKRSHSNEHDAMRQDARSNTIRPQSVPPLRAAALQPGSLVLGEVVSIRRNQLIVALPNGLRGRVRASEASDVLAAQSARNADTGTGSSSSAYEHAEAANGDDDHGNDADSDSEPDDEFADGTTAASTTSSAHAIPLSLKDLFAPSQRVRCAVLSSSQRKHHSLQLSLRLTRVQASLLPDAFYSGYRVTATIRSAEDYGYVLSFGLKTVTGFLRSAAHHATGALVDVIVESFNKELGVVTAVEPHTPSSISHAREAQQQLTKKEALREYEGLTLQQLMPGQLVNANVRNVLHNGLVLSFLTYFTGYVELSHLRDALPSSSWWSNYDEGQKVAARILYCDSKRKRVHLSLKPHLVNHFNATFLSVGTVIERAIIRRIDSNAGLLLELPSQTDEEDPPSMRSFVGYAHAPNVSDGHVERLERTFKEGELVKARVIGRKPIEGICSVSLKKSVVEQRFFSFSELIVGAVVAGTIDKVDKEHGAFIKLSEHITALCPPIHLSDTNSDRAIANLQPGKHVKVRVLEVNPDERKLVVTRKRQLLHSDLPILSSLDDALPGTTSHGIITGVFRYGCFVSFIGGMRGLAHVNDLGLGPGQEPLDYFERGQVVRCTVLSATEGSKKLRLSLVGSAQSQHASDSAFGKQHQEIYDEIVVGSFVDGYSESGPTNGELFVRLENGARGIMQVAHLSDHLATASAIGDSVVPEQYLGTLLVINRGYRYGREFLYLSKKRLLRKAMEEGQLPQSFSDLQENNTYVGYIANITDIGYFVRFLGSLTGLSSPGQQQYQEVEAFAVGQTVQAKVTSLEQDKAKFKVSLDPRRMRVDNCSSDVLVDMLKGKEMLLRGSDNDSLRAECPIGAKATAIIAEEKDYGILADISGVESAVGFIMHQQVSALSA